MPSRYRIWKPDSHVSEKFPKTKVIAGKKYHQSLINPTLVRNTGLYRARKDAEQIRKEGWAAQVVKFNTKYGYIYLVYERRTRRVGG